MEVPEPDHYRDLDQNGTIVCRRISWRGGKLFSITSQLYFILYNTYYLFFLYYLFLPGHQLSRGQGGPRGGAGQDGVTNDVSWHRQVSELDSLRYSGRLQALQQGGPAEGEVCPAGIRCIDQNTT